MEVCVLTKIVPVSSPFTVALNNVLCYLEGRGHKFSLETGRASAESLSRFDIAVGFYYPHILGPEELKAPGWGCINVHPAFLPYGRGAAPNVWAIIDSTPAGVTIHKMARKVDEGDILYQAQVDCTALDTGETLYERLLTASVTAFCDYWPEVERTVRSHQQLMGKPQPDGGYPTRKMRDLAELDDLEKRFANSREFINVLRARTFPGHESAYIRDRDGKKVYVRVWLAHE